MNSKKELDSEFTESRIETEYKSMDLNITLPRRNSHVIPFPTFFRSIQMNDNSKEKEDDQDVINEEDDEKKPIRK